MYEKEYDRVDSELGIRRAIETIFFKTTFTTFKDKHFKKFKSHTNINCTVHKEHQ